MKPKPNESKQNANTQRKAVGSMPWLGGYERLRAEIAGEIKKWRDDAAKVCELLETNPGANETLATQWEWMCRTRELCADELEGAVRRADEGKPPNDNYAMYERDRVEKRAAQCCVRSATDQRIKSFNRFCSVVNKLDKVYCDKLNADPTRLFGAVHHEFPASMLYYYHKRGLTPEQALQALQALHEIKEAT